MVAAYIAKAAQWSGLLVGAAVLYCVGYVIYQLYFHPLARYPGPTLGKLTTLYAAYHAWTGDIHKDMARCHEKYGKVIRYGPTKLIFNSAEGLKEIYSHGANVKKSAGYNEMVHRAPNTFTMIEKREHGIRRRIMSQGFSDAAMRGFEPMIINRILRLCGQLQRQASEGPGEWSPSRNMSKWFDYLTFDIMADVVFSGGYDAIGSSKYRYVIDAIETSNVRIGVLLQAPLIRAWKLDKKLFPAAIPARNAFVKFVTKIVTDRLNPEKKVSKDVFSYLQKATDPETGKKMGIQELGAEGTTLIVAGSDTTSTTLAGLMFYLTRFPEIYAKVCEEVRSTFSDASEITVGPKLSSCVYLRACIDETLRISPPVGSSLWREVQAGGMVIDGHAIPAGMDVGVGIWALQHNEEYYPNPYSFIPERWLEAKSEKSGKLAQMPMSPFSLGPRGCIGKGLAMVELMLTYSILIMTFDFMTVDDERHPERHAGDMFFLEDHVTAAKGGPLVRYKVRQSIPAQALVEVE